MALALFGTGTDLCSMKSALTRFLHLFMAVAVLLGSMGFGLTEHSCQLLGTRQYAVQDDQAGCGHCEVRTHAPAQTPTVERTDCCKDATHFAKVDATSSLSKLSAKFVKSVVALPVLSAGTYLIADGGWWLARTDNVPTTAANPPPTLSGRQRLIYIQTFLI